MGRSDSRMDCCGLFTAIYTFVSQVKLAENMQLRLVKNVSQNNKQNVQRTINYLWVIIILKKDVFLLIESDKIFSELCSKVSVKVHAPRQTGKFK